MSKEDSFGMSFYEVYDAFQNDFHRTPQKIMTVKSRNTHLKSTVESNNNSTSNYSNSKSEEEEQFHSGNKDQANIVKGIMTTQQPSSYTVGISNNTEEGGFLNTRRDKASPYDIQFDVLGNSLYESLQDCFTKNTIITRQQQQQQPQQQYFFQQNPAHTNLNHPFTSRFKFETSLDNIYITEDNFESMEDEDKENKDPLENAHLSQQQFEMLGLATNPTSPQQEGEGEEQVDHEEQEQIDEEILEIEEEHVSEENDVSEEKNTFTHKKLTRFEQNLMTPLNENHYHKQYLNESHQRQFAHQLDEEEVEQEESNGVYSFACNSQSVQKQNENMNNSNNISNLPNAINPHYQIMNLNEIHQDSNDQVVRFNNQLETIISFESQPNNQSNLINLTSNANNYSGIENSNYISGGSSSSRNHYSNNTSVYQQHLLQSAASQSNTRIFRNQQLLQSSTNRTPLRDITSTSISSSKKNYQGIKKMLEFSSPMINNWDVKTSQKSKNLSSKNSGSSKKSKCTPAIFCR